jgi:hypothetical protein
MITVRRAHHSPTPVGMQIPRRHASTLVFIVPLDWRVSTSGREAGLW